MNEAGLSDNVQVDLLRVFVHPSYHILSFIFQFYYHHFVYILTTCLLPHLLQQ